LFFHFEAIVSHFSLCTSLAALLVVCAITNASAADAMFTRDSYGAAPHPRAIAVADFNRDGLVDIATAGTNPASVTILTNDAKAGRGFRAGAAIAVGGGPFEMAAADLNRDGKVDLAIANADLNAVTILTGRGDGTFNAGRDVIVGGNPRGIALADVTGDGKIDILVTQYASNAWLLLAGDGAGGVAPPVSYATAARPQGIAAADLDHDGATDVIVAHAGASTVSVFYGAGRSSPTRRDVAVPTPLNILTTGDINRDGWTDVIAASSSNSELVVLRGSATGLSAGGVLPTGVSPRGIVSLDLNEDGLLDVAVGNRSSSTVTVYFGQADGTLGDALTLPAGSGSRTVAAADFDHDGRVDLVSANEGASSTSLFTNSTAFVTAGHVFSERDFGEDVRNSGGPAFIAPADFDHDGRIDIAIAGNVPGPRIFFGDGRRLDLPGNYPIDGHAGDFNGDGHPDLLTSEYWGNTVSFYAGDGRGGFAAPATISVPRPQAFVVGDFNRDGRTDLAVTAYDETAQAATLRVFTGRGDGTFAPGSITSMPATTLSLAAADFDGDGRLDVAFPQYSRRAVEIFYGDGSGGWRSSRELSVSGNPATLAVADIGEDGRPDLVVALWDQIALVQGTASGFSAPTYLPVPTDTYVYELTAGDVNLDGHVDIVTGNVDVYFGDGAGGFALSRFDTFGDAPTVLDVTADGVPDLLFSSVGWLVVLPGERNEANRPPVVSAGPDITVNYSSLTGDFTLGAQGRDPDLHELTYEWRNAAGDVVGSSWAFWPGLLAPGTYRFTVTAYDGRGGSASDTMTLTVLPYKEIVIHPAWYAWTQGNWGMVMDPSAASGVRVASPDTGAPKILSPLANPTNYFEVTFLVDPTQTYKLWIRGKAERNAWSNDSAYVQFSGAADASGNPAWRIGTTSALTFNLEECSGCGISGWGWEDDGWGAVNQNGTLIRFPAGGWQTLRIQTREDGLSIDQIVLSSERFVATRPGAAKNDTTILDATTPSDD
jgi:hypothetical protein